MNEMLRTKQNQHVRFVLRALNKSQYDMLDSLGEEVN